MSFEHYISQIETSDSFEKSLNTLDKATQSLGFDNYCFSNMNAMSSPAIFKVNFFHTNYPEKWTQKYITKQYVFHDPVAIRMMSNHTPFYWSKLMAGSAESLSPQSLDVMQQAQSLGIIDGVGMSYLHNKGNLYTFTLSKDALIADYDDVILSQAYLLGAKLVESFEKLEEPALGDVQLTTQEQKIVTLGAIGKTDGDIAQLMNISVNTVRYHWKNIFEKLNSYSRVFAIIQAMNLGFVNPNIFEVTTESGSLETYQKSV